jgi:hypothetical protein
MELADKDELFPQAAVHPLYRMGACTFGGECHLVPNHAVATGAGRGPNGLREASRARCGWRKLSRVMPDFSRNACGTVREGTACLVRDGDIADADSSGKIFRFVSANCARIYGMRGTLRTLRAVQWTMLGSILLYAVAGELLGSRARAVDPSLRYVFTTAGVAIVGVIFVVRRTLVLRSAQNLASHPDDSVTRNHWRSGYIATYALCELLGLFGLILRCMGCSFQQSLPFYIGGFVLLFFFGPHEPVAV